MVDLVRHARRHHARTVAFACGGRYQNPRSLPLFWTTFQRISKDYTEDCWKAPASWSYPHSSSSERERQLAHVALLWEMLSIVGNKKELQLEHM